MVPITVRNPHCLPFVDLQFLPILLLQGGPDVIIVSLLEKELQPKLLKNWLHRDCEIT